MLTRPNRLRLTSATSSPAFVLDVLLQPLDELAQAVDTDKTSNDRSVVLGQDNRLVGTNYRSIGHSFAGSQDTCKKPLTSHLFRGECKGKSDRQTKTFRNGHDNQSDKDDKSPNECDANLICDSVVFVSFSKSKEDSRVLTVRVRLSQVKRKT